MKIVLVGLVVITAMGVLVWVGIVEGSIPMLTVREAKAHQGMCRVDGGQIHSVKRLRNPLLFAVHSEKDPEVLLSVHSDLPPPDNFEVGKNVGLKGSYDPKSETFLATEVKTQCPSKYEAAKDARKSLTGPAAAPSPEKGP